MNNPNPFLSQGAFLDQKNKARKQLKIAVLSSIGLSVLVLTVLLIQGCKKPNDNADANGLPAIDTSSNSSATQLSSNPPPDMGNTSNSMAMTPPPVSNPPPNANTLPPVQPPVTPPPPPVQEGEEYTIVKGDTFATIGANHGHISAKAIQDANPGVDPKKLKIGQKIKLPAAAAQSTSVTPTAAPMATDNTSAGGTITHTVKSGDTLTTISKHYHVTIKAIQQANNLTTTAIKVGQKLKIPGATAPAPAETTPPQVPAPAPAPAPGH